jgi:hypothetical protein
VIDEQDIAAFDRLHAFSVEWGMLMSSARSCGNMIYELHPGDARWAELRHSDLTRLLASVDRSGEAGETALAGSTVGESAVPLAADAQTPPEGGAK